MINISGEARTLYKTDRYPMHTAPIEKDMFVEVMETGTVITDADMEEEAFSLKESICCSSEIVFGSCESSIVSFTVKDLAEDLIGKNIRIWQTVNGHSIPLGRYKVYTVTKRDGDARWKEVTAYDRMPELDRDVTQWFGSFWENRTESTVREFRLSFFEFMGFEVVEQELINDRMTVKKSIDPEFVKGRYIAQKIGEINACFGHFTREGKFRYISIGAIALYPSETLYPSEYLFPSDSTEIMVGDNAIYFSDESSYEDYYVRAIDSVQIKSMDGGEGVTVGEENKNPYIIHGNFLVGGKTDEELRQIAENFLGIVRNKFYIPSTTKMIGLPYLEVGDTVSIILEKDAVEAFIFERTLTGLQSLEDEIIARGNEYRKNDIDESTELMQLKAKVEEVVSDTDEKIKDSEDRTDEKIKDSEDRTNENLDNLSQETEEKFQGVDGRIDETNNWVRQTEEGLIAEVTRAKGAEGTLQSSIIITAQEIRQTVSETYETKTAAGQMKADLKSEILQTASSITSAVSATYETKASASETKLNLQSQITQTASSITSAVSATYETKASASETKLNLQSQITQTASSITSTVSATYETKAGASETRRDLQSQITQTANSIKLEVSGTYETKDSASSMETRLSSRIAITENGIRQTVSKGDVISSINQSAEAVSINANRINFNGIVTANGNFQINSDGTVFGKNSVFQNLFALGGLYVSPAKGAASYAAVQYFGYNTIAFSGKDQASWFYGDVYFAGAGSTSVVKIGSSGLYVFEDAAFNKGVTVYGDMFCPGAYNNAATQSPNVYIGDSYRIRRTTAGSLKKWKHDIAEIQDSSIDPHRLYDVNVYQFVYNDDYLSKEDIRSGKLLPGFVVDEMTNDYPIAVNYSESGEPDSWNEKFLIPPMLKLIQEQKKDIEYMREQLSKIMSKIGGI